MMIKAGIVGASGYTGAELIRILFNHPLVEIVYLIANKYANKKVSDLYPNLAVCGDLSFIPYETGKVKNADVVFIAVPHGESMKIVPDIIGTGLKVIDLSGDFRLKNKDLYPKWYGFNHSAGSMLENSVYGLPEFYREKIKEANLVSNPGCYPTSSILAVAPLIKKDMLTDEPIIINSCSGLSGAGRGLSLATHFIECNENVEAYSLSGHKHIPEMEQEMKALSGKNVTVTFVPHLVPLTRGILATAYCGLKKNTSNSEIVDLYKDFYSDEFFVKVLEEGNLPGTKDVLGSNYCYIGAGVDKRTGKAIVVSALDNLVKGASGQAVQNMNIMCGFEEDEGLKTIGMSP